jgi:hypothetical protein
MPSAGAGAIGGEAQDTAGTVDGFGAGGASPGHASKDFVCMREKVIVMLFFILCISIFRGGLSVIII